MSDLLSPPPTTPIRRSHGAYTFLRLSQVSVVVKSDAPGDTSRRLMAAWNDPSSRLHVGTITSLIDFSQVQHACGVAL